MMPKVDFKLVNDKMKIMEIEYFELQLTSDKEMLLPLFKQMLNPMQIDIIGAKDIPL